MKTDATICKPWLDTASNTASSLALLLAFAAGAADAATYRWVDAQGRVHYGDTLPDTYQQSGATEFNKQGRAVKRTQSDAERRTEAAARAEAEQRKRDTAERARQDRALLASYASVEEIELARERTLDHHRAAISSAETRALAVGKTLAALNVRKKALLQAGRPVPAPLEGQLRQSNLELEDLKREIVRLETALHETNERFAQDKARYRELAAQTEHGLPAR